MGFHEIGLGVSLKLGLGVCLKLSNSDDSLFETVNVFVLCGLILAFDLGFA
ncbi:unnamed protein product [Prunus armeniaca]